MVKTYYFLINKKCGLVGGKDYGSIKAAKKAIDLCNIPNKNAKVLVLHMNYTNLTDYSKCTPLKFN